MRPLHRSRMFWVGPVGCLLIAGMWVSSGYREYSAWMNLPGGHDAVFVIQESGAISFNHRWYPAMSLAGPPFLSTHGAPRTPRDRGFRFRWLEVMWRRPFYIDYAPGVTTPPAFVMSRVLVPHWMPILAWAAGWWCFFAAWRGRQRRLAGAVELEENARG